MLPTGNWNRLGLKIQVREFAELLSWLMINRG